MAQLILPPRNNHQPTVFGRYQVCSLLGEGAMGKVYLASDPVLDRQVAIKVITIDSRTERRTREEYLSRFTVEARASARLNHPSIVTIFDAGEESGVPWIAFEYVNGEPLQQLLNQTTCLPHEKAVAITLDITAALHHAHDAGIIHRDIKPANILIEKKTGIAKLADFGVVKAPWVALTQDGTTVGSPGYMAPEQLEGNGCDARSDLFSLGIVLYQMLCGQHPFMRPTIPATIVATLHGTYSPLATLRPDCPEYLATLVSTLLQKNPSKRFQSSALLLHELRRGSRPHLHTSTEFDSNAILGNATRIHRISHALKQQAVQATTRHFSLSALLKSAALFFARFRTPHSAPSQTHLLALPVTTTAVLLFLALVTGVFFFRFSADERQVAAQLKDAGYSGSFAAIINSCNTLLPQEQAAADTVARHLLHTSRYRTDGFALLARITLNQSADSAAQQALDSVTRQKNWRRLRERYDRHLLADCSRRLTAAKVDPPLTAVLAKVVLSPHPDSVTAWMNNPAYWLRWNSVHIAEQLLIPVDSVALYMLDLQYAGRVSTRTKAANQLGHFADPRAIKVLEDAAALGFKNPILSYTADRVLRTSFNHR